MTYKPLKLTLITLFKYDYLIENVRPKINHLFSNNCYSMFNLIAFFDIIVLNISNEKNGLDHKFKAVRTMIILNVLTPYLNCFFLVLKRNT